MTLCFAAQLHDGVRVQFQMHIRRQQQCARDAIYPGGQFQITAAGVDGALQSGRVIRNAVTDDAEVVILLAHEIFLSKKGYIYSLYHILTSIARQNSNKIQRKNPINNTFFYRSVVFVCLCGIDEKHIFCYNYCVYFAARGVRLAGRSGVTDKTLRYLITNAPTALRV